MPPIEEYLDHADELAQEVVNAWGVNVQAGNAAFFTDEFKAVFETACRYRNTKLVAGNHRQANMLSEQDAAEETATRQGFAEAYKTFWENNTRRPGGFAGGEREYAMQREQGGGFIAKPPKLNAGLRWDVFISHASEDKDEIARPLAQALQDEGYRVWYDELIVTVGDSLRRSIDQGLARSDFGVVILSKHFFEKHWSEQELNGLASKEIDGRKVILPVWHGVGVEEVRNFSPMLADRFGVATVQGLQHVVEQLKLAMR